MGGEKYGCVVERKRVWRNISVGMWEDEQCVVGVGTVRIGVGKVCERMDVVGGERVQVVGDGCAGRGRVTIGIVLTRRESESHYVMIQFDGCGQDERRGGQVKVTCGNVINTFDKRQWQSHDPGQLAIWASDRGVKERVDNYVLWAELGGSVPELILEFHSFTHNIVPGVNAQLFRVVCAFGPTHVMLVGGQISREFLARSTKEEGVRLCFPDVLSKEPRWEVLGRECK